MRLYRCFLLNETNCVFDCTEFLAMTDEEADQRAGRVKELRRDARGYSLWQGGRLVVESSARATIAVQRPRYSPPPDVG